MKRFLVVLVALGWLTFGSRGFCGDVKTELQTLVETVKAKIKAGKTTQEDLADELKGFDAIIAEHKSEKTDETANVLLMKAMLYAEVIHDDGKATETFQAIKTEFPDTGVAKKVDQILASLAQQQEAKKIQSTLIEGSRFPDFDVKDIADQPLSIAKYKGKIVLIDFWATWCGPCVHELPNVLKAYEKYHDRGFEIIGVSLDSNKDKLTGFIKEKGMTWSQYFDGKGWQNELAAKYGITSIPATYLLDKDGKIIGKGLRGDALDSAINSALGAK